MSENAKHTPKSIPDNDGVQTPAPPRGFLCWTIKVAVDPSWVADGFEVDDQCAMDMLNSRLGYATTGEELWARVISAPDPAKVRKLQGYAPDASDDERPPDPCPRGCERKP